MALPAIEQDVRTMLAAGGALTAIVPAARISHGYRLQDGVLPAITFELSANAPESIFAATILHRCTVEVTIVAATTKQALDALPALKSACSAGTYGITVFDAVIWQGYSTASAVVGEGDEQQPAEVTATIDIYYRE